MRSANLKIIVVLPYRPRHAFQISVPPFLPSFKHCYYADLRRVINEFCYLNNIQMSKNLLQLLKLKEGQSEFRRTYKREQRNTETSNTGMRQKIAYLPTAESESNLQQNKSVLLKSKSLETHFEVPLALKQSMQARQQQPEHAPMSHVHPTVSQIVKRAEDERVSIQIQARQRNSHVQ